MASAKQKLVNHELARLEVIGPVELQLAWEQLECTPAPNIGTGLLRRLLACRMQERRLGGLPAVILRELDRSASTNAEQSAPVRRPALTPGARLIREWQGVEHTVTVTLNGFEWQGRPYQSLSAIARAITGSRWNGWVFFGRKNKRRAA